jgi:hypothetical protein
MNEILDTIWKGVAPELQAFFGGLNWTFILMYTIILYGVTYKTEFDWFNDIMKRFKLTKFTTWITGILTGLVFCLFKWLENDPSISWGYVSTMLRSWFLVVVFASVFIDGIVKLLKFLGKRVDDKEKGDGK